MGKKYTKYTYQDTAALLEDLTPDERQILLSRAREMSHPAIQETEMDGDILQVITFYLMGDAYAIAVDHIRLIQPLRRLTRVPFVPPYIVGVTNLRGNILSLVDIRRFFGITENELEDFMHIIVVGNDHLEMGFLANRLGEIRMLPKEHFTTPPATINGIDAEYIEGVSADGLILLKLDVILNDPRMIIDENNYA